MLVVYTSLSNRRGDITDKTFFPSLFPLLFSTRIWVARHVFMYLHYFSLVKQIAIREYSPVLVNPIFKMADIPKFISQPIINVVFVKKKKIFFFN